jgi:FlaG/FlaF family flagellin (archaellin)
MRFIRNCQIGLLLVGFLWMSSCMSAGLGSEPTLRPANVVPPANVSPTVAAIGMIALTHPAAAIRLNEATTESHQASSLTEENLKNMDYSSGLTVSGRARLTNGEYREPAAPGSASETVVTFMDGTAYGLLTDGRMAAATILASTAGGSGTFLELNLIVERNGQPVNIASTLLGDRVKINRVEFHNGEVLVDMVKQGPSDAMCCPTERVLQNYRLAGTGLTLVSSEEIK